MAAAGRGSEVCKTYIDKINTIEINEILLKIQIDTKQFFIITVIILINTTKVTWYLKQLFTEIQI